MTKQPIVRVVNLVGIGLALAAAVPTTARILEPSLGTPITQLAAFTPWAVPLWIVAGGLLLVGRRRRSGGVLLLIISLLVALGVHWLVPSSAARDAARPKDAPGVPLRVMTLNVLFGGADAGQTVALVRRHQIDVLVVEEMTADFVARLRAAGIDTLLPQADLHPSDRAAGTGIWSRWALKPTGTLPTAGFQMPTVMLTVPGSGQTVSVTGVHTQPPQPAGLAGWRQDLATLADRAAADQGPRIYAGDFNASRDHADFRAILDAGLVDAGDAGSAAQWPGFTWPSNRPGPAVTRIDHILLTPASIGVRKVSVVTVSGTDHRGVVADLVLLPG